MFFTTAQSQTERDFQTWINTTVIGSLCPSKPVKYWLEGQERMGDDSTRYTQTLLRAGLGYAMTKNTSLWLGYAWIYTGLPLTMAPFEEDRFWQQLLWVKTTPYFILMSRTRAEQRFLENRPKTAYRLRELVKLSVLIQPSSTLSFVTSDEVFWHKNNFIGRNSRGFDQNRFFVGLGFKPNNVFVAEIGYMNQTIRRFGVPNFLAHIASINFFLTL